MSRRRRHTTGALVTGVQTCALPLSIQLKPTDAGAAIRFDYVVGGYMRFKVAEIAPAVDRVLGEQLVGLAKALGGALSVAGEDESGNEAAGPARPDSNLDDAMADLIRDDGATGGDAAPEPDEEP